MGKRVRPFLVYATGQMLGAEKQILDYAAAAIEAIHAYSLIHDDLPAMDDDNLRVGTLLVISNLMKRRRFLQAMPFKVLLLKLLTKTPIFLLNKNWL